MCLISILQHAHPHFDLIIVSNRDEYLPHIVSSSFLQVTDAGLLYPLDPVSHGAFVGLNPSRRFFAFLQTIDDRYGTGNGRSRGAVCLDCIEAGSSETLEKCWNEFGKEGIAGFSVLAGGMGADDDLWVFGNRGKEAGRRRSIRSNGRQRIDVMVGNEPFHDDWYDEIHLTSDMESLVSTSRWKRSIRPSEIVRKVSEVFLRRDASIFHRRYWTKLFDCLLRTTSDKVQPGLEFGFYIFLLSLLIVLILSLLTHFLLDSFSLSLLLLLLIVALASTLITALWIQLRLTDYFSVISCFGLLPDWIAFGTLSQSVLLREVGSGKIWFFWRDVSKGWVGRVWWKMEDVRSLPWICHEVD